MRNICCKAFSNHGNCIITQSITRARGLAWGFVTQVNLFENDVTQVFLLCFYTAVCTIGNVSLNVTRMLTYTDINISLTYFQKVGKPYVVERYVQRCTHLSLRITLEVPSPYCT